MKLSRLLAGAVLSLSLTLTGCSATSALSAVTSAVSPNKPELTAQVGAENTKQGIGVTAKQSDETKVGDVSGNAKLIPLSKVLTLQLSRTSQEAL